LPFNEAGFIVATFGRMAFSRAVFLSIQWNSAICLHNLNYNQ